MSQKPFRLAITMAGAVSAGAYTAGVMDYLLEALEEWEKRRGQPDIPSHRVVIPILGGASAGGMTAILTASTVNNPITPVPFPTAGNMFEEHPENKLYHSWVDLIAKDMFPKMLDPSDIQPQKIISLLNSQFIEDIAKKMIRTDSNRWRAAPAYFEMPLKVFTTLSNLEGFAYNVDMISGHGRAKYNMSVHNDYACFELFESTIPKKKTPGWIPLNFNIDENLDTARSTAMATGAFPVGLQSRELLRKSEDISEIKWHKEMLKSHPLNPGIVKTLNIDGGMINNEPFEKVRELLDDDTKLAHAIEFENATQQEADELLKQINTQFSQFENTVVMIDPFPSQDPRPFDFNPGLLNVIGKTLSAMTSQMRAKPKDYETAMETADASRFMISPSRKVENKQGVLEDRLGETAIASGTLGGFSGFISKEFRIHDYYLGRYNCEVFLRDYFVVPEADMIANPIFREGYQGIDVKDYVSVYEGKRSYPIIPLFTDRTPANELPMPTFSAGTNWPKTKTAVIDAFKDPMKVRIEKLLLNVTKLSKFNNFLVLAGARIVLNRTLANMIQNTIKKSLNDWGLLTDYVEKDEDGN